MPARLISGVWAETRTVASMPKARGGESDAEAVVAGGSGDHAGRWPAGGQGGKAGGGAAQLERARALQGFELQPDVGAGAPAEGGGGDERGHARRAGARARPTAPPVTSRQIDQAFERHRGRAALPTAEA